MGRHIKRVTRMRAERRRREMSQEELAKRLHMGSVKVHRLETGVQEPSLSEAVAIAKLFGIPVESIFELIEVPA